MSFGLGMGGKYGQNKTQFLVNQVGGRRGRAEGSDLQVLYGTQINPTTGYSHPQLRKDRCYSKDLKIISAADLGMKQIT